MQITYLGQSCFSFQLGESRILVDPFISGNPLAKGIDIDSLQADYIFLTHGHTDHVLDAERIGLRTGAIIVSNYEIVTWYEAKGLKGHGMNLGGSKVFPFGKVKYVNAVHSSVLPDGTYAGNPGGFVFEAEEANFYIAGDTALCEDMKLIPLTCKPLDFAILPIGDNFTMGYEDAVIAAAFINCAQIVGCHYDTFPPIRLDKEAAISAFFSHNRQLLLPAIGESIGLEKLSNQ